MKYELVFQIFQILVFQILAYLSIYHVSGMVSVWYRLKKTYTDTPKKYRYNDTDTDPPSLIIPTRTIRTQDISHQDNFHPGQF